MLPAMLRSVSVFLIAVACALWADAACAQDSPSDLVTRIDRLEETIRNLTGTVEQLQYRNQQLQQQVQQLQDQIQNGAGTRPQASAVPPPRPAAPYVPPAAPLPPPAPVIASAPPPPAPIEQGPPSGRRGDAFDPNVNPGAPGVPRPLGASTTATEPPPPVADAPIGTPGPRQPGAPLDLSSLSGPQGGATPGGALPPPPPVNPSATGAQVATLPPSNSPKDQYDLAYGYFLHKDYGLAATTFNGFLHQYPSDRLAPEAQFWLGESLFQNQQYHDAAEAFLAVSTKYETTARAPDALLRLGESLAALGEKEAACASLGEVLRKYPRASLSVKQSVDREQKRANC
jgi:tol-pal system protein YbgF